jgi:hypothetical protein
MKLEKSKWVDFQNIQTKKFKPLPVEKKTI